MVPGGDTIVVMEVGLGIVAAATVVTVFVIGATRRALLRDPLPVWFPGVTPGDVAEVSTSLARTAHLYQGFGRERAASRAVRALDRSSKFRPRVWSIATLDCDTLGRSTWFRLDDGTAVRVDRPVALVAGDPESVTASPELLLTTAELVAAHGRSREIVLRFRDCGRSIELRGAGAAIL